MQAKQSVPYSGKFLLVQVSADLPSRPSEEIFVVLNFMPVLDLVLANACKDIFMAAELSVKTVKFFCTMQKFPAIRYQI